MLLNELFTKPRDMKLTYTTDYINAVVDDINGREIEFQALKTDYDKNAWSIFFTEYGNLEATGNGGEIEVFGYAKHFLDKVIQQTRADTIKVEADDGLKSRENYMIAC